MRLEIIPQRVFDGCLLAALAHAVTVGEYPELNYEHSWDGINYCVNNSEGCRGTVTFHEKYIVGTFRDESRIDVSKDALSYFDGAPDEVIELARAEALQYMLDDAEGEVKPVITAAFWGTWQELYCSQTMDEFQENCGHIIDIQLADFDEALNSWNEYYELHDGQEKLIRALFLRKKETGISRTLKLNKSERSALFGDVEECAESLRELHILL